MNTYTLKELRRGIGRVLQDVLVVNATEDSTDALSFIDTNNLYFPDRSAVGRIIYFTSGANAGIKRVITDSTQSLGRVTWALAATANPETGDEAEIWRKRGQGYDPVQDINTIINDLLLEAQRYNLVHDIYSLGTFDYDDPTFSIPTSTRGIYAVEWQDDDDLWTLIPRAAILNAPGWSIQRDDGDNKLVIRGLYARDADTRTVRMRRYINNTSLSEDDDTTTVSYDWIVASAKANLLEKEVRQQDYASQQLWKRAVENADAKKAAMVDRPMPDTVML